MDRIAYLKHLQMVLKKFNPIATPNKDVLIWYFWDGFRPLIRVQLNKRDYDLENWNKAIEKTIDAKSKTSH